MRYIILAIVMVAVMVGVGYSQEAKVILDVGMVVMSKTGSHKFSNCTLDHPIKAYSNETGRVWLILCTGDAEY